MDAEGDQLGAKQFDYPDLFREVADALSEQELYQEALRFYEPLQQVDYCTDASFFMAMAQCYKAMGLTNEAEDCYRTIIEQDERNIEARVHLARLLEGLGMQEQAYRYVNEAMTLGQPHEELEDKAIETTQPGQSDVDSALPAMLAFDHSRGSRRPRTRLSVKDKEDQERRRAEEIQLYHQGLMALREPMLGGEAHATLRWREAAGELIRDFRSNRAFYPWDRATKSHEFSKSARRKILKTRDRENMEEMEAMAERLHETLGSLWL